MWVYPWHKTFAFLVTLKYFLITIRSRNLSLWFWIDLFNCCIHVWLNRLRVVDWCVLKAIQEIASLARFSMEFFWQAGWITRNETEFKFRNQRQCSVGNFKVSKSICGHKTVTHFLVAREMLILLASLPDSNLLAIVTLWPNKQYRGILRPTTPLRTVPVCNPILI